MQKLTLNVEELQIDGFETSIELREQGTVLGHDATLACTLGSCGHICP
ncbi:MAG: hypothetical protein JWM27_33 [Gemmatimonadetes bacterium]|nr:hypothetical protein [Gemmatimonadota bacterium]